MGTVPGAETSMGLLEGEELALLSWGSTPSMREGVSKETEGLVYMGTHVGISMTSRGCVGGVVGTQLCLALVKRLGYNLGI